MQEAWQFETLHLKGVPADGYKASPRPYGLCLRSPTCPGALQCRCSPTLTITSYWPCSWRSSPRALLLQLQLLCALYGPAHHRLQPFLPSSCRGEQD